LADRQNSFTLSVHYLFIYLLNSSTSIEAQEYNDKWEYKIKMRKILAEWSTREYNRLCEASPTKYRYYIQQNIKENYT